MRSLPFREVRRRLESLGFAQVSQTGSHVKFVQRRVGRDLIVIVPRHQTVAAGTIRSILRQAAITPQTWDSL